MDYIDFVEAKLSVYKGEHEGKHYVFMQIMEDGREEFCIWCDYKTALHIAEQMASCATEIMNLGNPEPTATHPQPEDQE